MSGGIAIGYALGIDDEKELKMSDPFRLDGKRAVVTGAGKGIGRGISMCLARAGADVVISARTQSDLDSLAEEIEAVGRKATKVVCDVTQSAQIDDLAAQALADGPIDIWVNNAGGLPDATPRYLTKTPEDRWDAQMDLNLKAVFVACQTAANNMDEGVIINISSSSAKAQGNFKNGPYGASKAAVNSLTQSFALELAPKIRVNAVAPGPVPTKNFNESTNFPEGAAIEKIIGVPLGRLGTPEDIGNAVVFMASPASSWVTGQCLFVTGGT
jgi:7-alpha-hydroxysteroid dehydrogenase